MRRDEPGRGAGTGRRRRWWLPLLGFLIVVLVAGTAGVAATGIGGWRPSPESAESDAPAEPEATATVDRRTMTDTVVLPGTVDYGPTRTLSSPADGTVTWLTGRGTVVRRGEVLFRVDERPVVLLFGKVPMYRDLRSGDEGSDVRQLERNLAELGYTGFDVDERFTDYTKLAVQRWQLDLGVDDTGRVSVNDVIFRPHQLRVADHLVRVGDAAGGEILAATGLTRSVTVSGTADELSWAEPGTRVTVLPPDGNGIDGKVASEPVPARQGDPAGSAGQDDSAGQSDSAGAGGAGGERDLVATIEVSEQAKLPERAGTPVELRWVAERRERVTTVPVAALLALADGGYGLEVVRPKRTRLVPVRTGMFADGRVEVSGPGITEGTKVVLPE